ncbi:MAG TPA: hypothetical protein PL182_10420 [Pseudobdellovibrionaceae bacterium]|nr:hypothetical protein [Pseudobdellovibrionaceae bacterium]
MNLSCRKLINTCQSGQCTKMPSSLCKVLDKMSWLLRVENELFKSKGNQPGTPGGKSKSQSRNNRPSQGRSRMPAGVVSIKDAEEARKKTDQLVSLEQENFPALYAADREFSAPDCSRYRNQDVLKLYENKAHFQRLRQWLDEEGGPFLEKNAGEGGLSLRSKSKQVKESLELIDSFQTTAEKFDAQQDESWKKIKEALPAQCRNDAQRVDLPMGLHQGGLNPNPTNLQVIGNNALYPEQFNPDLERELTAGLKALGLNPVPVDTLARHTGGGNVHCLSNEIRVCRPK